VFTEILRGFARGCRANRCALIGGETAQMPGFYAPGEYDVSGTIVGVVERGAMLDGTRTVRAGDAVIGLGSSGLHTNGYSLARRILFEQLRLRPDSRVAELGTTVGEELLKVHVSYGRLVQALIAEFNPGSGGVRGAASSRAAGREAAETDAVKAFAHITGGGFVDNIPRVLPARCDVVIRKGSWDVLPVFQYLAERGKVAEAELYQVFNMGIGMVVLVAADAADAVLRRCRAARHRAWVIGEVVKGKGVTRIV
jgi:phosphoribosylformylglycinamidine cyclo-ligase